MILLFKENTLKCNNFFSLEFFPSIKSKWSQNLNSNQWRASKLRTVLHLFDWLNYHYFSQLVIRLTPLTSAAKSNEKSVNQKSCNTVIILNAHERLLYFWAVSCLNSDLVTWKIVFSEYKWPYLEPCQSNLRLGNCLNGLNLLDSFFRLTLNTSWISRVYKLCVSACVLATYFSMILNSSVSLSRTWISVERFS